MTHKDVDRTSRIILPADTFSSGQIESKLWLCKHLEFVSRNHQVHEGPGYIVWLYGGWIGMLAFLLWTRARTPVKRVVNFDLDSDSLEQSTRLNETWHWKGAYRAICQNLDELNYHDLIQKYNEPEPHLIVNTAIEHMPNSRWYESIPKGKLLALQATDMDHGEPVVDFHSLTDLETRYPIESMIYRGKLDFDYNNGTKFSRFMTIGFK